MQCTPEQIEQKRREAQQKLAAKNRSPLLPPANLTSNVKPSVEPVVRDIFNRNGGNNQSPKTFKFKPYERPKTVLPFCNKKEPITATVYLISEDRFAVDISEFNAAAVEIFKSIPTRSYNPRTRIWDFHIKDYEFAQNRLASLQPDVVIGKLPNFVLNCCKMPKPDYSGIDLSRIDEELRNALMPFQEEGVCFGVDKNGRCLIADDMGLGKTFQALGIASYFQRDWPLLIATTASMRKVWEETIHRYLNTVSVLHVQYMTSGKDYIGDVKILIVSHDMLSRALDKLLERNFGVFIVDESHVLKNFKTKVTRAATELAKRAKRVILLSGTPALSRPSELYTQLSLLDEKFFGGFIEFSKRYCDGKTTQFGWDASGKSNLQELEVILLKKFMIRRSKGDVLKSLPNKVQEIVHLDVNLSQFSDEDRRSLTALAAKYQSEKRRNEKYAVLLTFFAETAKIKIPSVCSYILQILEETNSKFLVFAHHKIMLDAIEKVLKKKEKRYIRIDGTTTCDQRKYFVDKFQADDNYVCAILSITAANAGITLTAANVVLFAELHWNPSILSQAESRAHRIGQDSSVYIRYLLAPGTADDSIWPMLQSKQKILGEAGLCKDSFDNVAVNKQTAESNGVIADCLGCSFTSAGTLDITSYFKSPQKTGSVSEVPQDVFDDDFDDIVKDLDF